MGTRRRYAGLRTMPWLKMLELGKGNKKCCRVDAERALKTNMEWILF